MIKTTALLVAAVLGLAACGSSGSSSSTSAGSTSSSASSGGYGSGSKTTAAAKTPTPAKTSGSAVQKIAMKDNFFQAKTITGKPGSTVKIELTNVGQREHNFKIDSQKQADADVEPGKKATISVKIPTSGSVQFYCEYHKALGMTGTVKPS
jgi:plastocyanin